MNLLLNRRRMIFARTIKPSDKLPKGYSAIEYLESSGTQYIDTGFVASVDMEVSVNLQLLATTSARYIFGRYESSRQFYLYTAARNSVYQYGWGSSYRDVNFPIDTTRHVFRLYSDGVLSYLDIDGVNIESRSTNAQAGGDLHFTIFRGGPSSLGAGIPQRIYDCIIKVEGVKTMHLIPALRKEDNVVGMYDIVGEQFLTNEGSGDFNYVI